MAWCREQMDRWDRVELGTRADYRAAWLAKLVLFFYYTAAHPSVIANRERFEFRSDGEVLRWFRPKTLEAVEFPIVPQLKPWLAEWLEDVPARVHRLTPYDWVRDAGRRMGLRGLTPRTLRHTVASHLVEGYDINTAKDLTKTSDRILLRYAKRAATRAARARIAEEGF